MSVQVRKFDVTIPAGTAKTSPFTSQLSFPPMVVDKIVAKIPAGPRGTMGFAIGSSGQAVIPYQAGAWIIADNDDLEFDLDEYWDSGSWEFFGYNTGLYAHTVYLTFHLSLVATPPSALVAPIPPSVLSNPSGSASSGSQSASTASTAGSVATAPPSAPEAPPSAPAPPPVPAPPTVGISGIPPITAPALPF